MVLVLLVVVCEDGVVILVLVLVVGWGTVLYCTVLYCIVLYCIVGV